MLLSSFLVIVSTLCLLSRAQVCVKIEHVWRDGPETYVYTSKRNVNPWCLFWCDEEVVSETKTRMVSKLFTERNYDCCEGFIRDYNKNATGIHCEPICTPACTNGYCKSPGECACNTGYTPHSDYANNCIPQCQDCNKGTCVAPNICKCNNGYDLVNESCEPVCTEPCINGRCVAPDNCQCDPGYRKENNTCEQYCLEESYDGSCDDTSEVTCNPGWELAHTGSCEPICTTPCINASCVAPDTCECIHGYINVNTNACEPYCSSGCDNGTCIAPEICICDPGWYKIDGERGACLPHCDQSCQNGTCVAPNECECLPGYRKTYDNEDECVPLCPDCEGDCVEAYKCVCESPNEVKNATYDAMLCNCCENCTETNECSNAICVTNITDATVVEGYEVTVNNEKINSMTHINSNSANPNSDNINETKETTIKKATWWNSGWFYGSAVLIIISIILMLTAAIKRRHNRFKTNALTEITAM